MSRPIIAALIHEPALRARVQQALRDVASPVFFDLPDELTACVRETPVALVVLGFRDRAGRPTVPIARAFHDGFPSIPVIAYGALAASTLPDILELARAGVHQLVIAQFSDYDLAFRTAVVQAMGRSVVSTVLRKLGRDVPRSVEPILRYCLEHASENLSVTDVARAHRVTRQALAGQLRRASFPSTNLLISWCRLFCAAHLLEDPARSVDEVAHALNYPSGTALRNMFMRYLELRPREVRENGGLVCALHAFQAATRSERHQLSGVRRQEGGVR